MATTTGDYSDAPGITSTTRHVLLLHRGELQSREFPMKAIDFEARVGLRPAYELEYSTHRQAIEAAYVALMNF